VIEVVQEVMEEIVVVAMEEVVEGTAEEVLVAILGTTIQGKNLERLNGMSTL
jgi:hypothetical protein